MVETAEGPVDRVARMEEEGRMPIPSGRCGTVSLRAASRRRSKSSRRANARCSSCGIMKGLRLRAIGDMIGTSEEAAKNCLFPRHAENENKSGSICMKCNEESPR